MMGIPDPIIGRKLGDYTILELLGKGGMARVYKGYDEALDRYAAVKVITSDFVATADEVEYKERFQREARAIARLRHPNIVGVYQFNDLDGLYYMAMVFLDGEDLRMQLKGYAERGEKLPHADVLKMAAEVASALDYAHSQGVIHRDIKPSNIMMTSTGATLTDFGLALSTMEGTAGDTFGSAHYIAPEQAISSARAVPQSDLYSLGVVLYEAFTGKVPFDDPSVMSVALKHLNEPPPRPTEIIKTFPEALENVLLRVLEKDPTDRYQNGTELVRALNQALPLEGDTAEMPPSLGQAATLYPSIDIGVAPSRPSMTEAKKAAGLGGRPAESAEQLIKQQEAEQEAKATRRLPLTIIAVVGVLLIGAIIAFLAFGNDSGDDEGDDVANIAQTDAILIQEAQTATADTALQHASATALAIAQDIATDTVTPSPELTTSAPTENATEVATEIATEMVTEVATDVATEPPATTTSTATEEPPSATPTARETDTDTPTASATFTSTRTEEPTATSTSSPTATQTLVDTNTPSPTPSPGASPTATATAAASDVNSVPVEPNPEVALRYADNYLILENISGRTIDISDLVFTGNNSGRFAAISWNQGIQSVNGSLENFRNGGCIQVSISTRSFESTSCRWYNVWVPITNVGFHFFRGNNTSFTVRNGADVVAMCMIEDSGCEFALAPTTEIVLASPVATATTAPTATSTATEVPPSATPTTAPEDDTPTPATTTAADPDPDVQLRYTTQRLLLENVSNANIDLSELRFVGDNSGTFNAAEWASSLRVVGATVQRFRPSGCVQLVTVPSAVLDRPCLRYNVWLQSSRFGTGYFWGNDDNEQFAVQLSGETVARCPIATSATDEQLCEFALLSLVEDSSTATEAATEAPTETATAAISDTTATTVDADTIELRYNQDRFLLENISAGPIDISTLIFVGDANGQFSASSWNAALVNVGGSTVSFEPGGCVQLVVETSAVLEAPCDQYDGTYVRRRNTNAHFWFDAAGNTAFSVRVTTGDDTTMIDCPIATDATEVTCQFSLSASSDDG